MIVTDQILLYLKLDKEGPTRGKPHRIFKVRLNKILSCSLIEVDKGKQEESKGKVFTAVQQMQPLHNINFKPT